MTNNSNITSTMPIQEIIIGDCMTELKKMETKSVDLIILDPPYNIGKDSWDKIKNYEKWLKDLFLELQRVLKDNGSFYWFHSEMKIVSDMMNWMETQTNFIFRQFITWNKRFRGSKNKGFLDGFVEVEGLRNYQQMAEYILYYTFQSDTGLSKIMGHVVFPIREYIRSEILRAKGKICFKDINTILGTATNGGGVASATLSLDKTEPAMMTEEHYLKLRNWLNNGIEYEYLRKEYEYLRKEYEDLRYVFNNQKTHHSVWNYDMEKRSEHITEKPIKLIENIIRHSSKEGGLVLDPCAGSGTTGEACVRTKRNFICIEKDTTYYNTMRKRITEAVPQTKLTLENYA